MHITFDTLASCSMATINAAFNRAFEGYEIPLYFELSDFERKLQVEHFSPQHSIGAFNENQELVGFVIHCLSADGQQLYNAGTGVIAAYRGANITKRMYAFAKEQGLFHHINEVVLEVLVNNRPAYKSYVDVGFQLGRHFASYKGIPTKGEVKHRVEKGKLTDTILEAALHIAETVPSWQNNFLAMSLSKDFLEVYYVQVDREIVGYLFYNPLSKRIHQLAVARTYRHQGIATSMLLTLYNHHPYLFTMINIDRRDTVLQGWLHYIGLEPLVFLDELYWKVAM